MKEFIEKLIGRLEEELKLADEVKEKCARENPLMFDNAKGYSTGIANAKSFVNQLAEEYNNGWIPVSSGRLPEESEYVLAFVPNNSTNKIIIAPYHDIYYWQNGTITHWQPLPYQPKGE